ncbi:BTAD domain-containing putative transcriptional regulator [Streptomyces blattellae]|uniref:BTAD domain-containing putative transcriptional regulator n=1 Tax=Streptomyces blattellae TaxID=2569855 RepID=UPI0012B998FC|nr:BTAD domain-containing putative transcriptional regulator [Streptomyces blattellae]
MLDDGDSGTEDGSVLVRAKLAIPPLPSAFVPRARLVDRLRDVLRGHRVVAVSATAGAGKTTAVAEAARTLDTEVCWLTLDRTDSAPGRLFVYLTGALATRRPGVRKVARRALAAGAGHREAVAVAVEAIGAAPLVLVVDEVEQLGTSPETWAVLDAVIRFGPEHMKLILLSRCALPDSLVTLPPGAAVEALGETELAFTEAEAAEALAVLGKGDIAAGPAVQATGGWVTGVLFEAWRADAHVAGAGGEADPLHGYLSTHILNRLEPRDREFLVRTSVLDEVSVQRARALGLDDAGARLAALRRAHIPATWSGQGSLRCHSRFREFLTALLQERDGDVVHGLFRGKARVLAMEGRHEEATEVLLRCGLLREAGQHAEKAVLTVIERLDLDIVDRWSAALGEEPTASNMTTARLMAAVARDDFHTCVAIADDLAEAGVRALLAARSGRAAALMGWAYLLAGRMDDAHEVLSAGTGPDVLAVRYALRLWADDAGADAADVPPLSGGPMDAIVLIAMYFSGLLREVTPSGTSPWIREVAGWHEAAALRATGRIEDAVRMYEANRTRMPERHGLTQALLGSEILLDAGRLEEAAELLRGGLARARSAGAPAYEVGLRLVEIRLAIRRGDLTGARVLLEQQRDNPLAMSTVYYREILDAVDAFLRLHGGTEAGVATADTSALHLLRKSVDSMRKGGRFLILPAAAVCLAEAEWRAGDEDGADRAVQIALEASARQGSNHSMLRALADFPAVLSRRIDGEPEADSIWHALGRALIAQDGTVTLRTGPQAVHLVEFGGRPVLTAFGRELRPGISKSVELVAYLIARGGVAGRTQALEDLFAGRRDDSAQAYLRQAIRKLRDVLPEPDAILFEDGTVRLRKSARITSDSSRFEARIAEAARLRDEDRLDALVTALGVYDRGPYLEGLTSLWIDAQRDRLGEIATTARLDAAALALDLGRFQDAQVYVDLALESDPYREGGWRLAMSVANARGDDDAVLGRFRRCEQALARIGLTPAPATRKLLHQLRR